MYRALGRVSLAIAAGVFAGSATSPVLGHARLLTSTVKNHTVFRLGHVPHRIAATFAEELIPDRSWIAVFEGVADHGLVTEHQKSVVSFTHPTVMTLQP